MKKVATLFAVLLSVTATSAFACGDKATDSGKQTATPIPPKTSHTL